MMGTGPADETPLAVLEQRARGQHDRFELFVDRVRCLRSSVLGSRDMTLPIDTLSPYVVVRQRGPASPLVVGVVLAVVLLSIPGGTPVLAGAALLAGTAGWLALRGQYVVFPGQIADLQLLRDRPDASTARRFVARTIRAIEEVQRETRAMERQQAGARAMDRLDELLAFRDLYAEGIIDRDELKLATEILARRGQERIGFR